MKRIRALKCQTDLVFGLTSKRNGYISMTHKAGLDDHIDSFCPKITHKFTSCHFGIVPLTKCYSMSERVQLFDPCQFAYDSLNINISLSQKDVPNTDDLQGIFVFIKSKVKIPFPIEGWQLKQLL